MVPLLRERVTLPAAAKSPKRRSETTFLRTSSRAEPVCRPTPCHAIGESVCSSRSNPIVSAPVIAAACAALYSLEADGRSAGRARIPTTSLRAGLGMTKVLVIAVRTPTRQSVIPRHCEERSDAVPASARIFDPVCGGKYPWGAIRNPSVSAGGWFRSSGSG